MSYIFSFKLLIPFYPILFSHISFVFGNFSFPYFILYILTKKKKRNRKENGKFFVNKFSQQQKVFSLKKTNLQGILYVTCMRMYCIYMYVTEIEIVRFI